MDLDCLPSNCGALPCPPVFVITLNRDHTKQEDTERVPKWEADNPSPTIVAIVASYVALNDFEGVKRVLEEMETQDVEKCSWSTYSNLAAIYVNAELFDKTKQLASPQKVGRNDETLK
ncbi:hypothetical protein DVH24_000848 [Malus domestica]|uniref:Pentatricopeptide repeat-containing protein n=1 Tax=Malus domestica TaxID=3750 RepID=A0A498K2W0_MALDO|nr:hypothetical protein DVH24_000848 [Malus domestica]